MDNKGELNLGNIQDLSKLNKKLQDIKKYNVRERLPKSTINLLLDQDVINDFENIGRSFFLENDSLSQYSGANFFRVILINFYYYLLDNNITIGDLKPDQINALKKTGKRREQLADFGYTHDTKNTASFTFTIETKFKELAYILSANYYFNYKIKEIPYYSLVIFFYDLIKLIQEDKLKLNFYDKVDIDNWIKELDI